MKHKAILLFILIFKLVAINAQNYNMSNGSFSVCSGDFYDSGGASGNYSNNENLTITFTSSNGNRLQFNFQSFATENNLDILQIFDGPSTNAPLIGSFSGSNSPGIITSSGTSITFRFTSDGTVTNSGWHAIITCTTAPLAAYNMVNNQTIVACDGVFYDDGGNQSNYTHNQNTVMTFCPTSSSDYLSIGFPYQFILSNDDTLFAYSGPDTNSPLIGIYTGNNRGEVIISPTAGACITFRMQSNNVNNNAGWQGFITCNSTMPNPVFNMATWGVRYVCTGNFYDSGGPSANYGNNENRIMTFFSNNGNRLQFNFSAFATETNLDVLQIYDGPGITSPLIGSFSGTNNPGVITSTGNSITFRFISDGTVTNSGWNASISCTTTPLVSYNMTNGQTITTCSGVFYDDGGNTGSYSHNQNRVMTFCPASNSEYLNINFPYQFILSSDDTLIAYAGNDTLSPLLAKYTLNNRGEILASPNPGQCITFQFKSNSVNNNSGWQGLISCSNSPVQQFTNMGASVRVGCNILFYDSGGPNNNYGNNENRTITFYSNGNCGVRVDFSSFQTETNLDVLYVYDGPNISAPLIGTYSGNLAPFFVQSSLSNALTFRFISDATVTFSGWNAVVTCPNAPATPTITANPDLTVCPSGTTQLTSSIGNSYLWNTGDTTQTIIVANPGVYLVRVSDVNGCFSWSNPVTVTSVPDNTIALTSPSGSDNQSVCLGQAITNITYFTTGATGATFAGLPAGVTGSFNNGTIVISGTPNQSGNFNYTITLTGGCGNIIQSGNITIINNNTIALTSASGSDNQSVCLGQAIANITYATTGATGATFAGLPAGVTGSFNNGTIVIIGTPINAGIYNFSVNLTGGCGTVSTIGTINVTDVDTSITINGATLNANQTGAIYQWVSCNNGFMPITGATNQSFTVTQSGQYAVVINFNGCIDTSDCVSINISGFDNDYSYQDNWTVYPNPNNGSFFIDYSGEKYTSIIIYDGIGNEIDKFLITKGNHRITLKTSPGIYFVKDIETNIYKKIVIK